MNEPSEEYVMLRNLNAKLREERDHVWKLNQTAVIEIANLRKENEELNRRLDEMIAEKNDDYE